MSTPVLTRKQQQKSLSAKKKRKKGQKNILAAPALIKIRNPVLNDTYIPTVTETLELLLPHAKLSQGEALEKSDKTTNDGILKRSQLFLGINSVSRAVGNESAACILFGDDIKPKLLISHIIVLCSLKKIPYLYIENLRDLTKRTLGFSCVALGFKKDSTFFLPVITAVMSAIGSQNDKSIMQTSDNSIESCVIKDVENNNKTCEKTGKTFAYLHRNSNIKRAFVPDATDPAIEQNSSKDFISFGAKDVVNKSFSKSFKKKISVGKNYEFKKNKTQSQMSNKITSKGKCDFPVEYCSTEVIKVGANPNREKKKFVRLKGKKFSC